VQSPGCWPCWRSPAVRIPAGPTATTARWANPRLCNASKQGVPTMELVFERVGPGAAASSARFTPRGGVIGRAADCDWVIADSKRVISGQHARVTHRDGDYFLTDTSSNGIRF